MNNSNNPTLVVVVKLGGDSVMMELIEVEKVAMTRGVL